MVWTAMKFGPVTFQCTCHHGSHPFSLVGLDGDGQAPYHRLGGLLTPQVASLAYGLVPRWRPGRSDRHDDEVRALRAGPVLHADRSESDQPLDMTADWASGIARTWLMAPRV